MPMTVPMFINEIAQQSGYQILGQEQLPRRKAKFLPIPSRLHESVRNLIAQSYPDGLYGHQAEAIDAGLKDDDICLATSTASGKSLVYIALAADMILRKSHSRVIAFYPARALIQDQLGKWEAVLKPLNLSFGFIDGSLPVPKRNAVLDQSRVVLMTPDVAHAWLMINLKVREIRYFLRNIKLLILDEAHTYEGVFGTNMAYFLRRLQAVSKPQRIITSTATLDNPSNFVYLLTGRQPRSFGPEADGSATPPKTILLVKEAVGQSFECMVSLLENLARCYHGKFLAFGDSRRMVEQLVMALKRSVNQAAKGDKNIDQAGVHKESGIKAKPFDSLPTKFNHLLENEMNPSAPISQDLYPLKQRAAAGPHREFPIRTGMEHRSTPHGLMYELKPFTAKKNDDTTSLPARKVPFANRNSQKPGMKWLVAANTVQPIPGETKMVRVTSLTDESKPL